MINIFYQVRPKPAPRPRVTKNVTYNDKDYTSWKNGLKLLAKTKVKKPLESDIFLKIDFFYSIPKSWTKKKKESAKWHNIKPDIDNLIKSVMDSFNGVIYKDDGQVVCIQARKQYANFEGVKIEIEQTNNTFK